MGESTGGVANINIEQLQQLINEYTNGVKKWYINGELVGTVDPLVEQAKQQMAQYVAVLQLNKSQEKDIMRFAPLSLRTICCIVSLLINTNGVAVGATYSNPTEGVAQMNNIMENGRIIGKTFMQGNKTYLLDGNGRPCGHYDPQANQTIDRNGRRVGQGNTLLNNLYR